MVTVPVSKPATIPVADTDPVVGLLLLQVPPDVASSTAAVAPRHTLLAPDIAAGAGFTDATIDVAQLPMV
jgi:hypothetical protein